MEALYTTPHRKHGPLSYQTLRRSILLPELAFQRELTEQARPARAHFKRIGWILKPCRSQLLYRNGEHEKSEISGGHNNNKVDWKPKRQCIRGLRIDDTAVVNSATTTKWCNTCGTSSGDFLKESTSTTKQIAAISYIAGYQGTITFGNSPGDPRYRGRLVSDRWNFDSSRTDADPSDSSNKLDSIVDRVDINCRPYGFDWFDFSGDRPLAFLRNGPMINIGELGNIAACDNRWRTLYFQYPERPANSSPSGPPATEIPQRRSHSLDYVLADLFSPEHTGPSGHHQHQHSATTRNTTARIGTVIPWSSGRCANPWPNGPR